MSRSNARMARPRQVVDRVTIIVLVAFFVLACITAAVAFNWARSFFSTFSMAPIPGGPPVSQGLSVDPKTGKVISNNSSIDINKPLDTSASYPTPQPWDGSSRITLLVMGLDYRDWSEGADIPRTDSMILISLDPMAKTAGILSIPRDMWVDIPGMGYNKINTAYRWGELYKLPGGGPALAMKTVEELLGVPVNYYALIDFNAFVKFIDSMGGLDMKIREEIVVDPIGPGNTRKIEPGSQNLDGATVLAYARQRHTANDDFDRSARQQEVIMAIRKQILQFNMLPTMIAKAPELYSEISSGIHTNLTLDQVIRLAWTAQGIDEKNIKKGVIGPPNMVEFAKSPDGSQDILIPVPDQIRLLRDEVFSTNAAASPAVAAASGNVEELMKAEKARVVIENGTLVAGLAGKTSELLRPKGMNIISESNAENATSTTTIYDYSGKPYTTRFLIQTLNIPQSRVINRFDPNAGADIKIVLGDDWAKQQK